MGVEPSLLAITNPTRVPEFDAPAIAETLPGYDSRGWFGFLAPAGTPREIVTLLNQEINRAMMLPDVKDKLTSAGLIIVTEPPEFFAAYNAWSATSISWTAIGREAMQHAAAIACRTDHLDTREPCLTKSPDMNCKLSRNRSSGNFLTNRTISPGVR